MQEENEKELGGKCVCSHYQPQLLVVSVRNSRCLKELQMKSLLPVKTQAESLSTTFGSGH